MNFYRNLLSYNLLLQQLSNHTDLRVRTDYKKRTLEIGSEFFEFGQ